MKDFLTYLKSKFSWVFILVSARFISYSLKPKYIVCPTLSFDFTVIYQFSTWVENIFFQCWMAVAFYTVFWRPNRKAPSIENPQDSEV